MIKIKKDIIDLLDNLELELSRVGLWSKQSPSLEKMSSKEPFCVDQMLFEEWLQWIFIPRLLDIIKSPDFNGVDYKSDIHSMASYVFDKYEKPTENILKIIKKIDNLLNNIGRTQY